MEFKMPMNLSSKSVNVLVVGDDAPHLSVVAKLLEKCNYQVMTVEHPPDALSALLIEGESFDLVVTDVHKPDVNCFELHQVITLTFDLPVLSMSAVDKEGTILRGPEGVPVDDLRDQRLYTALQEKKGKRAFPGKSAMKQGKQGKDNSVDFAVPTKSKIMWSESLHNKFLAAIIDIGFDEAKPAKILEHMKVPELTRGNVSSHFQKYRNYMRRVTDASCRIQAPDINLASRANQLTIASGTFGKCSQFHQENFQLQSSIPSSSIHASTGYLTGNLQHLKNKGVNATEESQGIGDFSTSFMNQGNVQPYQVNATEKSQGIGDFSTSFMNQGNVQPHQVNATEESQGIGDLSTTFMNQGNVQTHQQNNEDEMSDSQLPWWL